MIIVFFYPSSLGELPEIVKKGDRLSHPKRSPSMISATTEAGKLAFQFGYGVVGIDSHPI